MKKFSGLLIFVLLLITGSLSFAANTLVVDNTYVDMGSIEPGKGGWDFSAMRDVKIGVTCNIDTNPWTLTVKLNSLSGGTFDPANIKFKVYYIGYAVPAPQYWLNVLGSDIAPFLNSGFNNNEFMKNTTIPGQSATMTLLSSTAPFISAPTQVKLVLGVTIQVPEGGSNIAGDYSGELEFELN